MASDNGHMSESGPAVLHGLTPLYDGKGGAYLVPDYILPAAKLSASAEYHKDGIDKSKATGGVSHLPFHVS